jgi:hypothetical protein
MRAPHNSTLGFHLMIFAFVEGGTLTVYESAADAIVQWEGIDAEDGNVMFYDERGIYLEPVFSIPNLRGSLRGFVGWVESGTYHLVPVPNADVDTFALALYEAKVLEPNKWFANLEDLKAALSAKGIPVKFEPNET